MVKTQTRREKAIVQNAQRAVDQQSIAITETGENLTMLGEHGSGENPGNFTKTQEQAHRETTAVTQKADASSRVLGERETREGSGKYREKA